ncbi:hypothetical protein HII31_06598 [Pseudocercospora fuligena]|uniref:Uncharacterized protein n=1 Tax=Pseudocercospora fuligena TaxID=685502 RepID=A0A8H6VGY2_9PEZI|nr:hypothetical protein HII31_06598 [Pseudocercospora fuligena]
MAATEAPLFITAEQADHEQINRLLIYLRDWEYGSGDRFSLITTQDPALATTTPITSPPINPAQISSNPWLGSSLPDLESFVLTTFPPGRHLFIVLDDEGLRTQTCIIVAPSFDPETGDPIPNEFVKIRVPWDETYIVWTNLDLQNMDFEDFVQGDRLDGGWHVYASQTGRDPNVRESWMEERDAMLEREGLL